MSIIDEMAAAMAEAHGALATLDTHELAKVAGAVVARRLGEAMEKGAQLTTENKIVKATIMLVGVDAIIAELERTGQEDDRG